MKRAMVLLIIVCIFVCFSGCENASGYAVRRENGESYIHLDGVSYDPGYLTNCWDSIYFDSREDMLRTIWHGTFSEEELDVIRHWIRQSEEPIGIPDFEKFPELSCPAGYDQLNITWMGWEQWFYTVSYISDAGACTVRIHYVSEADFSENVVYITDFASLRANYIVRAARDSKRGVMIYSHTFGQSDQIPDRSAVYSFDAEIGTFYVMEKYKDNEILPHSIKMYVAQSDGKYIFVTISNPLEIYSMEWLNQFGLVSDN